MSSYSFEGMRNWGQHVVSDKITCNLFSKSMLLAVLFGATVQRENASTGIGRKDGLNVLSGAPLSEVRRRFLSGCAKYSPNVLMTAPSNGKKMGLRDTMPTVANRTTASHDQLVGRPVFHWASKAEPIWIWNSALRQAVKEAGTSLDGQRSAVANVTEIATQAAMEVHTNDWATAVWQGSPTNQGFFQWDDIAGIDIALSSTNTYANVDRAAPGNDAWQSNRITAAQAPLITQILDKANLTYRAGIIGGGIDLVLTTPDLYQIFKDQLLAKSTILTDGLPAWAKYGIKQEVLQYGKTMITFDPFCPANYVGCFSLKYWLMILAKDRNFTLTKFQDQRLIGQGAEDGTQAFIETDAMLVCEDPKRQVLFTNVA
jgi:hypothetical protein